MRTAERGTETHDIHARILAENDGTFEAGMVYLHDALFAVLLLVDFLQEVEYLALRVRIPAAVLKTVFIPAMLKQLSNWAEI